MYISPEEVTQTVISCIMVIIMLIDTKITICHLKKTKDIRRYLHSVQDSSVTMEVCFKIIIIILTKQSVLRAKNLQ